MRLRLGKGQRKYAANASWLIFERAVGGVVSVVVIGLVARHLGANSFGALNYADSLVSFFIVFSALGLESVVIRDLVKGEHTAHELVGTSILLRFAGGAAGYLLVLLLVYMVEPDPVLRILVAILGSRLLFHSLEVIDFYFQSRVQSKYVAISKFVSVLFGAAVKISLVLLNADVLWFAVALVVDVLILIGMLTVFYRFKGGGIYWRSINFQTGIYLLKASWPLMLSMLAFTIYQRIDQVMLRSMLDLETVGYYAASGRIYSLWAMVGALLVGTVYPWMVEGHKIGKKTLEIRTIQVLQGMLFVGLVAVLVNVVFADLIINLIFGPEYAASAAILKIYTIGVVFHYVGQVTGRWITISDLQRVVFYRTGVAALLNIILNYLLIPKFGAAGAAWATVVALAFVGLFGNLLSRSTWPAFTMTVRAAITLHRFRPSPR